MYAGHALPPMRHGEYGMRRALGRSSCQFSGFDPESPGFEVWSPVSGSIASISGLSCKLKEKLLFRLESKTNSTVSMIKCPPRFI